MLKYNLNNGSSETPTPKKMTFLVVMLIAFVVTIFLICFLPSVISAIKGSIGTYKGSIGTEKITELNKTYEGDLIITATDIKVIDNPYEEDDNNIIVGVRFEVTNNSSIDYSSLYGIDAYVDDVKARDHNSAEFDTNNEALYTSGIAPGKKVMGYATAEATKDSKKVEFLFEEPSYTGSGKTISFVFDIPAVE